ncbi:MAG TPA: glucose-6-phosphate isomerase [Gammaproteobacteria bacterium]
MDRIEQAWNELAAHAARLRARHLRELVHDGAARAQRLVLQLDDLRLDLTREKLDGPALDALLALGRAVDLAGQREAMFAGEAINLSERRAVLHVAARDPGGDYRAQGVPVSAAVAQALDRCLAFADAVRAGRVAATDGRPYRDVVSIGIGGSDLGPAMATQALAPYHDGPAVHYVANVDGAAIHDTLARLDPATTLVIVQSKTFTTLETMTNARAARAWLAAALGAERAAAQLAAVSTNLEATRAFGIDDARVFGFWEWIGGRYSVWSAIGLPLAIAIGGAGFRDFLAGARTLDAHFRDAPPERNLPVLMGLAGVWRRNAMGCSSVAVVPYDQRLARLPAYLQQLTMESNGKRVTRDGRPLARASCPVVWGEPGSNAQHSFFQLLHQGSDVIPVDFLLAAEPTAADPAHHALLVANCLAQSQALALGLDEAAVRANLARTGLDPAEIDRLAPQRTFPGDRPSTTLLYRRLDPASLGRLLALYEHKTFVEAALWQVNAFDQWGVELGKALAGALAPLVAGGDASGADPATAGLLAHLRRLRETP